MNEIKCIHLPKVDRKALIKPSRIIEGPNNEPRKLIKV